MLGNFISSVGKSFLFTGSPPCPCINSKSDDFLHLQNSLQHS